MTTASRSSVLLPRASAAIDNLRAFVILLVLSFHAVLAYLDFLPRSPFPFDSPPYLWRAFPIVDTARWFGFDLFCAWQDVFLMSLFFFVSGLFVWRSIERKGIRTFLRDRIVRLGLPFAFVVALLMPIANYPTYVQTALDPSLAAFWRHWLALPFWPCGPMWFFMVVADSRFGHRRAAPVCALLGCHAGTVFGLCRRSADTIFRRPYHRFGLRLRPACSCLYAVGMDGDRTLQLPAQPPIALRGLFLRWCRPRGLRHRAWPVRTRGCAGKTLEALADCGARVFACLDGADRADDGRDRLVIVGIANPRRSRLRSCLLLQLLCDAGARPAVCRDESSGVGYTQARRLRDLSGTLHFCRVVAVCPPRRWALCARQGHDCIRRHAAVQLGHRCRGPLRSGSRGDRRRRSTTRRGCIKASQS